jgi:hypothetical protein
MLVSSFNLSQSFNYAPYLFCKKRFKSEINCFCIRTQGRVNNDIISLHIQYMCLGVFCPLWVCGRYMVFITCIWRVCAPQVCNFKLLQCSALLKHAFIYQPMCGGQWARCALFTYDPIPDFLPADSRWRICVLLTCITITAPKMSSFP